MRNHSFLAVLLGALLSVSTAVSAQGYYRLDIALEGPWILYEEHNFIGEDGTPVSVLIAIAPTGVADPKSVSSGTDTPLPQDSHYHHRPQVSSGNGFYIPSKPNISCLAFDGKCAHPGVTSLTNGHGYPKGALMSMSGGNKWLWQSVANGNTAVVLPMPDFYSNDGVWPMRFRKVHILENNPNNSPAPVTTSIGIFLHYSEGPHSLALYGCSLPAKSVRDCPAVLTDANNNPLQVLNTGTLRLQMRAPETTDACDPHVRYAYHQLLSLVDPNYANNTNVKFIEPAQGLDPKGNGVFDTFGNDRCFSNDHEQDDSAQQGSSAQAYMSGGAAAKMMTVVQAEQALSANIDKLQKSISGKNDQAGYKDLQLVSTLLGKIKSLVNSPWISDVREESFLVEDALSRVKKLTVGKEPDLVKSDVPLLRDVTVLLEVLNPGTKNGGDCRAPLVLVQ